MSAPTPGPWAYGVRADGSIWISLGDPQAGAHHQFDWYGTEADARYVVAVKDLADALEDMLAGWRYIRQHHGDLYGVGWDRAQTAAEAALSRARGETL